MGKGSEGGGGTSNNVYIRSEEYAWIPARLVEQDKDTAKVAIPQYEAEEFIASDGGKAAIGFKSAVVKLKDYQNHSLPLQNCGKDGKLKEVDDMVDLPYLHEVRAYCVMMYRAYYVFVICVCLCAILCDVVAFAFSCATKSFEPYMSFVVSCDIPLSLLVFHL